MIFACSFTALIDTDGTSQDYLFATEAFATDGSGTPANTPALPRLVQPGNLTRSIANGRTLFGLTTAGYGEITIANADGELDALPTYGCAGQDISVYCQDGGASPWENYPSGFSLIYTAVITSVLADGDLLRIRVREKIEQLNRPICPLFDGSGGLEGDATLAGTPKPVVFGGCYNVAPVLIDANDLIYMVSYRGEVSGHHAKDKGSVIARMLTTGAQELDAAADYAGLAALSVPPGHYGTCTSESLLKLGSPPVGTVTCDALEYASGNPRTDPQDVIEDIVEAANIPGLTLDVPAFVDFDTWNAANNSQCAVGYFAHDTSTTYADALSAIATSVGAWVGFNRDGEFTIKLVTDPSGETSVLTITDENLISLRRVVPDDPGRGVPYAKCINRYPRNWTLQGPSDLAGVVPASVRAEVEQQYPLSYEHLCEVPSDANPMVDVPVTDQFVGAIDYIVDGYAHGRRVTSTGDLEAYVTRGMDEIAALIGVQRDWFDVVLPFTEELFTDIDIGAYVTVQHRRHGLSAGKQFMVVAVRYELSGAPTATLTLWG